MCGPRLLGVLDGAGDETGEGAEGYDDDAGD